MKFDVLTLFPEMFEPLKHSIIERASKQNLININLINIRDFSKDKHKKVDDTPYGGGAGMVMRADVVYDAYKSVKDEKSKVIFLSPQGKKLNQAKVQELSKEEHLILLCGHYEGVDQRVLDANWRRVTCNGAYRFSKQICRRCTKYRFYKRRIIFSRVFRIQSIHKTRRISWKKSSRNTSFWKSSENR